MSEEVTWQRSIVEPLQAGLRRLVPDYGAPLVPVVRISGAIGRVSRFQPGLSLSTLASPLKRAFAIKSAPAVAILINSPGGSPVQSHLIYKRIRALSEEKEKPVIAFVEDVCASGGYMIACAADEIVVDPASIVGSIGVVSAGFGFVELMQKVGVERRVYTSGESKVILDPFQPEKADDVARLKAIQEEVHDHFIDIVRARRGAALSKDREQDIFSGQFWSGRTGVALGLADRVGDLTAVMREKYGDKVRFKLFSTERSLFGWRGAGIGRAAGSGLADRVIAELDERALWERYRL
jgi:signal peptide peptidase SppA